MSDNGNKGKPSNGKTGAVMVVGAGICGMQTALDLANSGFKVYLVEEGLSIGGRMAQLDKTFPTNDCSMCMISPKLIEVGKHLNIEIITNAQMESIEGEEGNLKVTVRQKPRYVDMDKCTGCGLCGQVESDDRPLIECDGELWALRLEIDEQKCIQCGECAVACKEENKERQGITNLVLLRESLFEQLPTKKSEHEILMHEIARMSQTERGEYWRQQLGKCIKCYGCREVCPICLCADCELDDPEWVRLGQIPVDFPFFHLIRAYHVGESCINCGACEDTCPMGIPLRTLMFVARMDGAKVFDYVPGLDDKKKTKLVERTKEYPISERKVRV